MILRRLILTLTLVQVALSQGGGAGSIHGVVLNEYNGTPYADAEVELLSIRGGRVLSMKSRTGATGEFEFTNLPAGSGYQLVVTGQRLQATAYGQRSWNEPWAPLNLEPGEHLRDLTISVQPMAAIRGKVVDGQGKGIFGATVVVMRPVYKPPARTLQTTSTAITDQRGVFQFSSMPAGLYYVRVSPQNSDAAANLLLSAPVRVDRSPQNSLVVKDPEGYPVTYFPSTTDVASAKPINLTAGGAAEDIDITVSRVRTGRVRGMVTYDGQPLQGAQILLQRRGSASESNWTRSGQITAGEFDIRGVLPGSYTAWVRTEGTEQRLWGRTSVDVRGGETNTLALKAAPAPDISGRISFEGATGATAPDLTQFGIYLIPNVLIPFDFMLQRIEIIVPPRSVAPSSDGLFTFRGVMPSDYRVVVSPLSTAPATADLAYLKSAKLGSADIADTGLEISTSFEGSLDLVLAADTGGLDGRVLSENKEGGAAARVVLVPDSRHRQDRYLALMASPTGRFQIQGIPPGKYKVFAWKEAHQGSWYDPDFLRGYEERAISVQIESGSAEYVEIKRMP